ncbi:hypothetical protein H0G86_002872 [Trichoderma simmonsii]|uniref:Uncharacterized protein n=1 Tax=Trichoderma simmonsii TaxID=1491479 RepID=A0A8G0L7H7_9HYPO|nr:hypothetical protein H0G86_002872 [Trichoderma simmonsii]
MAEKQGSRPVSFKSLWNLQIVREGMILIADSDATRKPFPRMAVRINAQMEIKPKIIMELKNNKKEGKKMDDTQTAVYLRFDLQPITNGASYLPGPPFLSSFFRVHCFLAHNGFERRPC